MAWLEQTVPEFRGLNMRSLWVDRAFINLTNQYIVPHFFYTLAWNCARCPFRRIQRVNASTTEINTIVAARNAQMRLYNVDHGAYVMPKEREGLLWEDEPDIGQFGVYDVIVSPMGIARFETALEPVPIYWSLLLVSVIVFLFYWLCKCINYFVFPLLKKRGRQEITVSSDFDPPAKKRLKSLDIFRGISIVLMIFVNYGGGFYWWTGHAVWNGFLLSEIVFPWFLFIMGVCVPISIKSIIARRTPAVNVVRKVFTRSFLLFAIGICMFAQNVIFSEVRVMNVLQRFAIIYLVIALVHYFNVKYPGNGKFSGMFDDVKMLWKEWIGYLLMMAVYMGCVYGIKLDGCDRGYDGPGGIHEYQTNPNCTGGLVGFVDRILLTEPHMFRWNEINNVFSVTQRFDPEGLFATIPAIFHAFIGIQCGMTLIVFTDHNQRIFRWLIWGSVMVVISLLLTFAQIGDEAPVPINKQLWSLSYVTSTAASSFYLLAFVYYLVDVKDIGDDFWTIFSYPGMNAILLYVGHLVLNSHWPFHWSVAVMNTHLIYLLKHVWTVIAWIFVAHILYHKKMFFSL